MKWGESQELRGSLKPGEDSVFLKKGKIDPGRISPSSLCFPTAQGAVFSLFLFLALRARSEGEEEEEFFPRLTFQGTQFTPSLFPFQAASEVLPVTATSDPKLRG